MRTFKHPDNTGWKCECVGGNWIEDFERVGGQKNCYMEYHSGLTQIKGTLLVFASESHCPVCYTTWRIITQ